MKIKTLLLCTTLLLLSKNVFAEPYQRCSDEQITQILNHHHFDQDKNGKEYEKTYRSCLNLDENTQLFAISNSISQLDEYEGGNYDLHLYLIDKKQNKILQRTENGFTIGSDADHFDGITLDVNRFSTLPNTDVVAFKINHSHRGGFTYGYDSMYLYKVSRSQPLQVILDDIGTNEYGYVNGNCGENNSSSDVKRIFILSDKTTHGLQDIILKEQKNQVIGNWENCKSKTKLYKQQQTLKFNGKEYKLQHHRLFEIDPF